MNSRIGTSELIELLIAFVVLTVAFSFMFAGVRIFNPSFDGLTPEVFFIAAVGVGSGFLLHELAHKFTAQRFGYYAEFKTNMNGLLLTIGSALFGFLFAAPGAVHISRPMYESYGSGVELRGDPNDDEYWDRISSRKANSSELYISIAGVITNLLLAAFFLALLRGHIVPWHINQYGYLVFDSLITNAVFSAMIINIILAAFNMIPIGMLDGAKVIRANPLVWAVVGLPAIILWVLFMFKQGLIVSLLLGI